MSTTAAQTDLLKYVDEVTKCPVCLDDVKNPKILPCFHTFCLECIKKFSHDKLPGNAVVCPVCRKEFEIPVDGVEQLPHSSLIDGLAEAKKLKDKKSMNSDSCDGCSDDVPSTDDKTATMLCSFCLQKLCDQCSKPHSKIPGGSHKLVQYSNEEKLRAIKLHSTYCHKHRGNIFELYCLECQENLCLICKVSKHDKHNCQTIVDIFEDYAALLQNDSANVVKQEQQLLMQFEILERKRGEFSRSVSNSEQGIRETGADVKLLIDDIVRQSVADLGTHAVQTNKETENMHSEMTFSLAARRSLLAYSAELLNSGNPCDITNAFKGLRARAEELLAENENMTIADDYSLQTIPVTSDDVYKRVYDYIRDRLSAHKLQTEDVNESATAEMALIRSDLESKLTAALDENNQLKTELAKRDQEYKQLADQTHTQTSLLESQIKQLQQEVSLTETAKVKLEHELTSMRNDTARIEQTVTTQRSVIDDLTKKVETHETSISERDRQLTTMGKDIEKFKKETVETKWRAACLQTENARFEEEVADKQATISKLNQQVASHLSDMEKLKREEPKKQLLREDGGRNNIRPSSRESVSPCQVKLIHSFSNDKHVTSVTTLDSELYVKYADESIAVYDKETFSLQRRLSLEVLNDISDMASCKRNQCVYIADSRNNVIHRVQKANNKSTKWAVGDQPASLSVNSAFNFNVIVTCCEVHKVKVFTTNGALVKEINLQQTDVKYPRHTVQLSAEEYVVCHGNSDTLNRVVIVDGRGHIKQSFGTDKGPSNDQLNLPWRLAVVKIGVIFVADLNNQRVMALTKTLRYLKHWNINGEPSRIWFEDENDRLYVTSNHKSSDITRGHVAVNSFSC